MIFGLAVVFGWFLVGAAGKSWIRNQEQWLIVDLLFCITLLFAGMMLYGSGLWRNESTLVESSVAVQAAAAILSGLVAFMLPGALLLSRQHWNPLDLQTSRLTVVRPSVTKVWLLLSVAVTEEILFRGLLIHALNLDGLSRYLATAVSWGLFCLVHLGWKKITALVDVALAGIVICAAFLAAGLIGAVIAHCLYNTSTAFFCLKKRDSDVRSDTTSEQC